jgi:hypothetical protein
LDEDSAKKDQDEKLYDGSHNVAWRKTRYEEKSQVKSLTEIKPNLLRVDCSSRFEKINSPRPRSALQTIADFTSSATTIHDNFGRL